MFVIKFVFLLYILCVASVLANGSRHNRHYRRRLVEADSTPLHDRLHTAKLRVQEILSLIFRRYELDSPQGGKLFATSNNLDEKTWNILKWSLSSKIVNGNSSYLMIFGGSSVTAGHDNFYNQSYPYIFKRRMNSIFEVLGIDLIVHNIAMGANNCVPYIMCYESMGGSDPNFIGWEQSYNCGHDDGVFESAIRAAGWNSPAVTYYSASGAWSPGGCPPSNESVAYNAEHWTPQIAGLPVWNASIDSVTEQKKTLIKFNENKPSSVRFAGHFSNDYKGVGTFGFNVWEKNELCRFRNPKNGKDEACCAFDAVEGCTMKFMTKEASIYGQEKGNGAAWHPPRAFHMLRGEVIAWIYSLVLFESLSMIEQDLHAIKDIAKLREQYAAKVAEYKVAMPHPKRCQNNYRCDSKPECYTDFKPHYSEQFHLSDRVVGETHWVYDPADYSDWSLHYGYLDTKPTFTAKGPEAGELHFQIHVNQHTYIWLCGLRKESLAHAHFALDKNVLVDAKEKKKYKPGDKREIWTQKRDVVNECKELNSLPKGDHVLSVSNSGNKTVEITHLIMWP